MPQKRTSLSATLRGIVVIPLLCLGIVTAAINTVIVYTSMTAETRDALTNLAHALSSVCSLNGSGDYSLRGGVLYKGDSPFSGDAAVVDDIHQVSGVDATIFYGDARALTSIRNPDGSRATGTHAAPEVVQTVLEQGRDYFSSNVPVNGISYFGYYMPLRNPDQAIVGMVFVGKTRSMVMRTITHAMLFTFFATAAILAVAAAVAMFYARKIVFSLNKMKEFLGRVAQGDVDTRIDPYLLRRTDEIGEMGQFTVILQKSITDLVGTDALTGLYNRRSCGMILTNLIKEYDQYKTPFVLALGDIDHFKAVNDRYGHQAGDAILRELAAIFMEYVGRKGFVARWGGEEFLLIYERMDKNRVAAHLEELQETIRASRLTYGENTLSITMTFGVAEYAEGMDMEDVLKMADNNLYYGKEHGRDCVV